MAEKYIYHFEEGGAHMGDLLGGKGSNLAEMSNIGLPVPPGFTVTTDACRTYLKNQRRLTDEIHGQIKAGIEQLARKTGRQFADPHNPLLVSVRSGAKFSMPGMMDTILNLGLNDDTVAALAHRTDPRFAWDAYRRFIQMYATVVSDMDSELFGDIVHRTLDSEGASLDAQVSEKGWQAVVEEFQALLKRHTGEGMPQDPWHQLEHAVCAVFDSWNSRRAADYRQATGIPNDIGTAVNIVTMVFGNIGWDSGSGVAFTRNPSTGEKRLFGEYLLNAQGEDVVSGARTPTGIEKLKDEMPEVWESLRQTARKLEQHYSDMQDIEFTIESGKLWMLQTRSGKRTAAAAVKIAVEMLGEGLISKETAVSRVEPAHIDQLLHPRLEEAACKMTAPIARGLNASPGAAIGKAVFDADRAVDIAKRTNGNVILIRPETTPDDVHGMLAAKGILTQRGGATSHAAVVARQLGKPCVSGCEDIRIDTTRRCLEVGDVVISEGDVISIDGTAGAIYNCAMPAVAPTFDEQTELKKILAMADGIRRLKVMANADTPKQANLARRYGAQGIGLCRTEHMFLGERTEKFQEAILSEDDASFQDILDRVLLPLQREDFEGIFSIMDGLPVIIRLLDPPLHEFLPPREELMEEIHALESTKNTGEEYERKKKTLAVVGVLQEYNPMLGLRGCRLGLMRPELYRMQVRAIFEAACTCVEKGVVVQPEIMIPLISHPNELVRLREILEEVAESVMAQRDHRIEYKFGTMIELPRAAITADEIAREASFFSFGTNDLTQMTYGISRDDAERKFLLKYVETGILPENPFQTLDEAGVGTLVAMAMEKGRKTRPDLEVGICGEHGGDPKSIRIFHRLGLDYVSCSPLRIPVARLAAAQAAIKDLKSEI
jgi:pyruvate,orthophosphate dikinase